MAIIGAAATAASSLIYVVAKEVSAHAFSLTISQIFQILTYFGTSQQSISQIVHQRLQKIIPTTKLGLIRPMMDDFVQLRAKSAIVDSLSESLSDSAHTIESEMHLIKLAVLEYESRYFFSKWWSPLDVEKHYINIQTASVYLEKTFDVLISLLPSCVRLSASKTETSSDSTSHRKLGSLGGSLGVLGSLGSRTTICLLK